MLQRVPRTYRSTIRIFSACLLAWLLIIMPLVPLAPATSAESGASRLKGSEAKTQSSDTKASNSTSAVGVNAPVPQPAPEPMFAPSITATKDDGLAAATTVAPGGTINYTVTINNNGANSPADDALNVMFSDTIDPSTTLVPGSPVAATSDKYNTIGNVQMSVPDGATDLLGNDFDPDTGNNAGMTATAETKSSTNCTGGCTNNVTINANGSFTYDPPIGFSGTDTFTYTANSGSSTVTATVRVTVANKIWFINNNAGACTSNCDGRLSHPFASLAAFNAVNDGAAGHPGDNDWIFVFESPTAYTGPANLRLGQKFIGQDATAGLITLTGFTQPSGTDPIPAVNAGNGTIVQITTGGIALNSGNLLRGFTVGSVSSGAKISGTGFGTLVVGNSASPDVTLNGGGQALNLTNGTLSTTGRFVSVATTSSTGTGISLTTVADSDGPGGASFSFSSTTVSGSTTQGILIGTTTADLNFGNTSVTGGTDAISLQNNSNGTRTFGTITTSGNSGVGFLHGAGGGAVSVTGATSITNPGGNGIDVDSSNANLSFAGTTVSKNNAGIGVDLTNNPGRTISFSSLAVTTTTGFAINTNNGGTVNVTTGSLAQSGAGGGAASLTATTLGMTFTTVASDGGVNGLLFSGGSGSFTSGTTTLLNNSAIGLSMAGSAVVANFGNTTVNSSAGDAVDLSSNTANITFADLDLTPDANQRGLDAQNNTGTITSTSGDIAATGAAAVFIDGPAGRTPLAMVLNNVDSTNSTADGLSLTDISGSFAVNDGTLATNISNSTGTGITVNNSTASVNFNNTSVTGSGNANGDDTGTGVFLTNNSGATTFGSLTITPDSGERGLFATDTDGATAAGAITIGSGTITTTNDIAVQVTGATAGARTPLNIQLTAVNTTGGATAANGIVLQNTNTTGSPGGFRVLGTGGACDATTPTCTGGRITNTTGADGATGGNGILLNTVDKVVLTRMRLDTHTNFALRGFTVTGLVMDTCLVDGTNGNNAGFFEGSVVIDGLFGTAAGSTSNLITASTIKGGWGDNIRVTNNTATAGELSITNSTIRDTNTGVNGNDNVHLDSNLNANLKVTITGSTFAATNGDHIQTVADGTSQFTIVATGNTFSGGGGGSALGQGITISGGNVVGGVTDSTETVRFNISSNTMNGTIQGGAININQGVGNGNWQGQVSNNIIGTAAVNGSGASQSAGIRVENHAKGILTAIVSGNTVRQWSTQGINLQAGDTSATGLTNGPLNVTLSGNTVANPNPASAGDHGIQLNIGTQIGNNNVVCADIINNNSLGNAANGGVDYRLRQRMLTTIQLPGYTGLNNNNPSVRTYILGRPNTANQANPNDVAAANNVAGGGGGYVNTPGPGNPCAQPTVPTALTPVTHLELPNVPQRLDQRPAPVVAVDATRPAKSENTVAANLSNEPSFLSRAVTAVANFANAVSGMVMPTAYASETVNQPVENIQSRVKVNSHHAQLTKRKAENRNATTNTALAAPMSGETVTGNIGTLPAGGTTTIKFSVTVNNAPNLTLLGPPRVENQGTVVADGGINVLTDDPDFGGATDKTRTLIDLFDTTTTLASDLNPSNFGDLVTFTATINETPVQGTADPTGTVDFIDTSNGNAVICDNVTVSGGQAQCQTSTLTAGTHNVRADYSGDGNFDASQSNIVAQVVNACTPNPIVTSTADAGAGSLREALNNVCSGTTITFNLAGAGPHTITLTTGELVVAKNVTINNNSGESITVSGNNASRVFNINSGKTASIIGLTMSGGSALDGGAVINDGALTIVNSTLSGNAASGDGGAISTTATGTSLTLINTTLSGNTAAGSGGGLIVLGGTATSINSTITNNKADSDNNSAGDGGGIRAHAGTTTLKNTIVAGNFNEDGATDAADDISGTVDAASSFNLIGTGGSGGLTNGVNNNQVGVANAGLGTLGDNGGSTQTHALLPTSTAVEAGGNANLPPDTFDLDGDLNTAETLPVDQRGLGFPRNADSSDPDVIQVVDIGAFELHPSIEDILDQSTSEDTVKNVTFNIGDDTGSLIATVAATSSNTTLVPNANLVVTGSGGSRNLQITPAANQTGTTTITVTVTATNGRTATDTFDLTVNAANDPPSGTDNTVSTAEDTAYTFSAADFGFTDPNDTPPNTLLAVKITTLPGLGTLTYNNVPVSAGDFIPVADINAGLLKFTPAPDGNGTPYTTFTFQVQDNGGGTDLDPTPNTMTINVTAVNDGPINTVPGPQSTTEDTPKVFSSGNLNQISVADVDAGSNPIKVTLTATNGTITLSGTAGLSFITGDGTDDATMMFTGTLASVNTALDGMSFNPTPDFNGAASLQIVSNDQGNTGTGGPLTDTDTVNITVNAANDAPVVTTTAGNLAYTENDPATAIDPGLTVTDQDSTNLTGATVAITGGFVSAQDTLGFTNQLGITGVYNSGTGVLTLTGTTTVANYQTALRTVTYANSSDNPTTSRTITFVADDGSSTSTPATRGITITAVNDAPVNTVPGPQSTNQNTPLIFSSGNGNQISVADVDAGTNAIQVTLTATNGTLTLSGTAGLAFTVGDGTADATMTFTGTIANINAALNGMTFTPTAGFSGAASLTITTNDLGNTGAGGPLSDTDTVNIQVATNISIQDASVNEPQSGSVNMIFTVTLSAPAPAGGASVDFTTVQEAPAINHATAGQDYTTTSGTVNFAAGEQFKTIQVPVLSDNKKNEANETFQVVLSNPVNATIADGTATGTIIENAQAGTIIISELRTSGPAGAGDDFVEVYNNTDTPHTVNGTGGGYGLFKMGASCSATPVLIGVIPNGTVIPARGHYLFTGSAYSLADYGGTGNAAGDTVMSADIESDRNVALFSTASLVSISSANRLDAVGFGSNTGGTCDLFREGTTLPALSGSVLEYSYVRDECGKKGNPSTFGNCPTGGLPKDSNVNNDDFFFIDTTATATAAGQRLGAPGPQNLGSPRTNFDVLALLLDSSKSAAGNPNRVRDTTVSFTNALNGTMSIRRRFVNNTGAPVTRLRIRVVDISTAFVSGGVADLRVLTSGNLTESVNDPATCLAAGFASAPCNVTVLGTTLETPPAQPLGGGFNSSVTTGTVTLATPLAPGASINLQILLGVQSTGSFKFFFNVEALP